MLERRVRERDTGQYGSQHPTHDIPGARGPLPTNNDLSRGGGFLGAMLEDLLTWLESERFREGYRVQSMLTGIYTKLIVSA